MGIGNNIKRRRLELGMSQQDLAVALGYHSRSSIAKVESGMNDIPLSKLLDLASTLDTTVEKLLTGNSYADGDIENANQVKSDVGHSSQKTAAIFLAGGKSTRNRQCVPNQFFNVLGKPVIVYSLEVYQDHPMIDDIVIVCLDGWGDIVESYAKQFGITKIRSVVKAGGSGIKSIRNGIQYITACGYRGKDRVILQESTRPFVTAEMISSLLLVCDRQGSSVTGERMGDNVQFLDVKGRTEYIDRNSIINLQSPDAYTVETIQEVFAKARAANESLDDNCMGMLMSRLGYHLNFCEGSYGNMKIIRQEDISVFTALVKRRL